MNMLRAAGTLFAFFTCTAELLFSLLCCSAGKGTAADNIEMERLELELG